MARIAGRGTLTAAGDTTVDSTAADRGIRIRVFNRDTVAHKYTFKVGTTELDEDTLPSRQGRIFGSENVENGTSVVIAVAEATTTNASTYSKTGDTDA
jgi:hypothetical protein